MSTSGIKLVVASSSKIRLKILKAAGVIFQQQRASIDEEKEKQKLLAAGVTAKDLALLLAKKKAASLSDKDNHNFILGFDQVMVCGYNIINKPVDPEEAKRQLLQMKGKECHFFCAASIYRRGEPVWEHLARPSLTMADFDETTVNSYLNARGASVCDSAGSCQIEGCGIQLVKAIYGSYYAVLGVPLLPLLQFFRRYGNDCPWLSL